METNCIHDRNIKTRPQWEKKKHKLFQCNMFLTRNRLPRSLQQSREMRLLATQTLSIDIPSRKKKRTENTERPKTKQKNPPLVKFFWLKKNTPWKQIYLCNKYFLLNNVSPELCVCVCFQHSVKSLPILNSVVSSTVLQRPLFQNSGILFHKTWNGSIKKKKTYYPFRQLLLNFPFNNSVQFLDFLGWNRCTYNVPFRLE